VIGLTKKKNEKPGSGLLFAILILGVDLKLRGKSGMRRSESKDRKSDLGLYFQRIANSRPDPGFGLNDSS